MDNFIKQIIEERFESKKQQRYFYAKANDKTLSKKERLKWVKMAKEFSEKTNFKKLPDAVESDVDEVVNDDGNIISGTKPTNANTKGITSKFTTDDAVGMSHSMMGSLGVGGFTNATRTTRYWGESDMSKSLGYEDTLGNGDDYEEALDHFENELGLDDSEAEERVEKMGYDSDLPNGKIRLIENPKEYIKEYLDNLLKTKAKNNELVDKTREINNPIIKKQLNSLKQTLKDNDVNINDAINFLKHE